MDLCLPHEHPAHVFSSSTGGCNMDRPRIGIGNRMGSSCMSALFLSCVAESSRTAREKRWRNQRRTLTVCLKIGESPPRSAKQRRTRSKSAGNLHYLAPQTCRMLSHGTTPSQYLWSRFVMRNVLHRFRQRKERSARGAPYSSLSHQERRFRT